MNVVQVCCLLAFLAQVRPLFGAGVKKGWGPAPKSVETCAKMAYRRLRAEAAAVLPA